MGEVINMLAVSYYGFFNTGRGGTVKFSDGCKDFF